MNLGNAFGIHEQALKVWSDRNELLASNIANADTPGYKARDIDFKEVLGQYSKAARAAGAANKAQSVPQDNARHYRAGEALGVKHIDTQSYIKFRNGVQASEDGNTVDIQTEQLEYAKNLAYFEATMNFLNGKISGIKTALGK
jgi:flagellar basal-body rod protein FlgB